MKTDEVPPCASCGCALNDLEALEWAEYGDDRCSPCAVVENWINGNRKAARALAKDLMADDLGGLERLISDSRLSRADLGVLLADA